MTPGKTWLQELGERAKLKQVAAVEPEPAEERATMPVVEPESVPAGKTETRQQKWRRLHPERYRAGQAKLMQRRRAEKRSTTR